MSFCKELKKIIIITRGVNGSVGVVNGEIFECMSKKNLEIKDLTGAGDLFASGFLHGYINNWLNCFVNF